MTNRLPWVKRVAGLLLALAFWGCAGRSTEPTAPVPSTALDELRSEIDEILADPAFANAHWGVMVQSLDNGQVLYRRNERKLFMPASNMKLATGAAALAELGSEHRFTTTLSACGTVDESGVLRGDLIVRGGGDPAISARFTGGDPLATFRAWSDSLKRIGIRDIDGNVVGDDDLFDDVHIGPGWAWDYLDSYYAAEIGALLFNEGVVDFIVVPDELVGGEARITANPPTKYLQVTGRVTTTSDSTGWSVAASRRPFSNDVVLTGAVWVGADSVVRSVAAHDPTMFFVTALTEALESEGIAVSGRPIDRDSTVGGCDAPTTLFVHFSPTLGAILGPFLKVSQNQVGEVLLRYLGVVDSDEGTVSAGSRVVTRALTGWGIPEDSYIQVDGSGLSRYNYLAPEALVRLLRRMHQRPDFEVFYDALPVAGVDGTLESRMKGTRAQGNARAKTGSISNARSLSGYVTTLEGELLAFSIIANNFATPIRPVEYVQDLIVERLANLERR